MVRLSDCDADNRVDDAASANANPRMERVRTGDGGFSRRETACMKIPDGPSQMDASGLKESPPLFQDPKRYPSEAEHRE